MGHNEQTGYLSYNLRSATSYSYRTEPGTCTVEAIFHAGQKMLVKFIKTRFNIKSTLWKKYMSTWFWLPLVLHIFYAREAFQELYQVWEK